MNKYKFWYILISILTLSYSQAGLTGWFTTSEQEAAQLFQRKQYSKAALNFTDHYRKGVAQYRAGDFHGAAISFERVSRSGIRHDALYNLGNARFQLGDFVGAIAAYENVLQLDPKHEDAAYNLALVRSML
ncbi:hypothetical protein TI05_17715, partial [Achromatium sp. WMS3]